jgi:RHS repeat-associated protein
MVSATAGINGTDTYGYGPDSKRVYKMHPNGNEEYYFWLGSKKLGVYTLGTNGSGNLAVQSGVGTLWFGNRKVQTQDRLGSTTNSYYPYGEDRGTAPPSDADKFVTYYRDLTTGLDYADHRYYSSSLGSFLTPDPYMASASGANSPGDPKTWNRYSYVGGDPVNNVDHPGLFYGIVPLGGGDGNDEGGPPDDRTCLVNGEDRSGSICDAAAIMNLPNPDEGGMRQPWPNQPNAIGGIVDLPMQQTILGSFAFAVARIAANPKCADMFGGWDKAMTTLGNTNYRVMPLGGPALDARGMVTGTGAATFGPTDVWINSQGFFFDQNVFVPASGKFAYFDFGTGLSGNDWGALLLLHELGHQTGVFKPDAGSPGLNSAQTQSVLDNCFTSAGGGLYK